MKMKMGNYLLVISTFFCYISCTISAENFPEPHQLKVAIAESFKVPFDESIPIIYNDKIGICGNSSEEEIDKFYNPQLIEVPYSEILTKNYNGKIWFKNDSFYNMIDSICQNRIEGETVWDCFSKDKIEFSLRGEVITNEAVMIYESYQWNGKCTL